MKNRSYKSEITCIINYVCCILKLINISSVQQFMSVVRDKEP